jgi:hypothetical protein
MAKKSYHSPSLCLGWPNALSSAFISENYCRIHERPGQNIVDAWGAERRLGLSMPPRRGPKRKNNGPGTRCHKCGYDNWSAKGAYWRCNECNRRHSEYFRR